MASTNELVKASRLGTSEEFLRGLNNLAAQHGYPSWRHLSRTINLPVPPGGAQTTIAGLLGWDPYTPDDVIADVFAFWDVDGHVCLAAESDLGAESPPCAAKLRQVATRVLTKFPSTSSLDLISCDDLRDPTLTALTHSPSSDLPSVTIRTLTRPALVVWRVKTGSRDRSRDQLEFLDWLECQRNRRDRVGDLARDVMYDVDFPTFGEYEVYEEYVRSAHGCPEAFGTLRRAFKEFRPSAVLPMMEDAGSDSDSEAGR